MARADLIAAPAAEINTPARPVWVPPLDIAERIGRETLAQVEALDPELADRVILAVHVGSLQQALRQLLDAIEAEGLA